MPIAVVCPSCKAKLKAPDNLLGKTVKCPACTKAVLVKATAAVAPPRTVATAIKPAPKKQPPPEELEEEPIEDVEPVEDEEEDFDEKPKKKKKKKSGSTDSERTMALFIHISAHIVNLVAGGLGLLVPIIIWLVKRKDSPFIDHHGKTWLNFTINLFVAMLGLLFLSGLLAVLVGVTAGSKWGFVGFIVPFLLGGVCLGIYGLVMNIIAAVKAKKGEWYEYRVMFRVFK